MTGKDEWLKVESLDLEARGVARNLEGKVVFVEGALPGEEVQVSVGRSKKNWEQASVVALRHESSQRVRAACPHFGLHAGACGGCKMQHLDAAAQVAVKQRALEDQLQHLGKVRPEVLLRPLQGPSWGYRDRARMTVRWVAKKGEVLIGFHERKSRYVADMKSCAVLPAEVSAMLVPLRRLIESMATRERLPQIELAVGRVGSRPGVIALVLRHLEPLPAADVQALRDFAAAHGVQWWLQSGGPDTVQLLQAPQGGDTPLAYRLDEFGLDIPFKPTDFTQVNAAINQAMVSRAVRLLGAGPTDRVIDWFCGLGNFTLPLALGCAAVLGLEGSAALVQRARDNAARAGLGARTRFEARDLFALGAADLIAQGAAERWLIDPPREGAFALAKALADALAEPGGTWQPPRRIVYISCNPATLARDAGLLVHQAGYVCKAAGVINMFPHTAHVESMAVFERPV